MTESKAIYNKARLLACVCGGGEPRLRTAPDAFVVGCPNCRKETRVYASAYAAKSAWNRLVKHGEKEEI